LITVVAIGYFRFG